MKHEKFKLLAEKRVNSAIKQIQLVGNLANPNSYEYTETDVKKISDALSKELTQMQSKFKVASLSGGGNTFTL